jgi:hypothetical protein
MSKRRIAVKLAAALLTLVAGAVDAAPDVRDAPRLALFGFELINTSLEPTAPSEVRRIGLLNQILREELIASGRFDIVEVPSGVEQEQSSGATIDSCNGCQRAIAAGMRANLVAWGTVQKVSNLILNINLLMEEVETGKMQFIRSVDIRGNTDESWRRGLQYLLRNYLLSPR